MIFLNKPACFRAHSTALAYNGAVSSAARAPYSYSYFCVRDLILGPWSGELYLSWECCTAGTGLCEWTSCGSQAWQEVAGGAHASRRLLTRVLQSLGYGRSITSFLLALPTCRGLPPSFLEHLRSVAGLENLVLNEL